MSDCQIQSATEILRTKKSYFNSKTAKKIPIQRLGRPYSSLPVPEGGLQESWRGTFYKDM